MTTSMIKEWEYSVKTLIYHFRCILRGMIPFALSWKPESGNKARADLDDDAVAFIEGIASIAEARRK